MSVSNHDWERRIAEQWTRLDDMEPNAFVAAIDALAGERTGTGGSAAFESACARDSTGHSDLAVPLYREALERGLTGERLRRASIQLASSLRNIGRVDESIAILTAERARTSDALDDAVAAALALALCSAGRDREGASIALSALAPHLPRYQRSMANYARLLVEPGA